MGIFSSKEYLTVPEYPKLGSKEECKDENNRGELKFLFGYGDTSMDALNTLSAQCKHFGVPLPKQVPGTEDNWYCGTFDVKISTKTKTRYNTVWFKKREGRWMAYTRYPPM